MIGAIGAGALAGRLFLLILALVPRRPASPAVAAFDAAAPAAAAGPGARAGNRAQPEAGPGRWPSSTPSRAGSSARCAPTWRSWTALEIFLATKLLLGVVGFCSARCCCCCGLAGLRFPVLIPVWRALAVGGVFFFLPDLEVKRGRARRRDFRRASAPSSTWSR